MQLLLPADVWLRYPVSSHSTRSETVITADLVSRITLFAKIPESERATLAARAADIRLRQGEWLVVEGQAPSFFGLLEGRIDVLKDVAGREERIFSYGPGDSFGELPLLLGSTVFANLRAAEPCRLLRLEGTDFLQLLTQCQVLSSEVTRTLVARVSRIGQYRVEHPAVTATVIGHSQDPACYELRNFLSRNRVPFAWQQPENGPVTLTVLLADGTRLENPTVRRLAEALAFQTRPEHQEYDVAIVGGGAAGLAAAVYGASEGLRTVLLERDVLGGQAGSSSRIENYLGFPNGLSGDELSERARRQALRFGAELVVTRTVGRLELGDHKAGTDHTIVLDGDHSIAAKTVVLATGIDWRRLVVPGIDRLVGHGVYYGAAPSEASLVQGRTVHLVGGGNSAGQAAMFFAEYAESVTMLVRGSSLAESMSQYLIDRLSRQENVTIELGVEVSGVEGQERLEAIEVTSDGGRRERRRSDALFVLIGGEPQTAWLPPAIVRDQWGYVCTGRDVMDLLRERPPTTWPLERDPFLLETSIPGIFAAGDVRHGSIKRCAAAVGEGSMSIAVAHQYLGELRAAQPQMSA
jgi:thioredoxin reductase (NADPH)